jgi:hypothetical protein
MTKVEEVARAIAKIEGYDLPNDMSLPYAPGSRIGKTMSKARAAIEAMREPTIEMRRAGSEAKTSSATAEYRIYAAMIDAALEE